MFEKDPKITRIAKYSILLSVKESYLLSKNFLGLFLHPFQTIRSLFREKDYSQIILIFSFPFFLFFAGLSSIYIARRIFKNYLNVIFGVWGIYTKTGVVLISIISFFLFIYIFFWLYKVIKLSKK